MGEDTEQRVIEIADRQNAGIPVEGLTRYDQVQMWHDLDWALTRLDRAETVCRHIDSLRRNFGPIEVSVDRALDRWRTGSANLSESRGNEQDDQGKHD